MGGGSAWGGVGGVRDGGQCVLLLRAALHRSIVSFTRLPLPLATPLPHSPVPHSPHATPTSTYPRSTPPHSSPPPPPQPQIANLKKVAKGSPILLLDQNGGQSKSVARELSRLGFSQVYVVEDGFKGWVASKLATKEGGFTTTGECYGYMCD